MNASLRILSSKADSNTWESFTKSELKLESVHQESPLVMRGWAKTSPESAASYKWSTRQPPTPIFCVSDSAPSPLSFYLLFTSGHLELLHAVIQDFSSHFGTTDRVVNFLIGHWCIIFLSLSILALSRGGFLVRCSHIQSALRVPNWVCKQILLRLRGQIT